MAEEMEELEVASTPVGSEIKKPRSALKTGLAVGAMTLNPFFGIAAGLTQSFRNKSFLEREAALKLADRNERNQLNDVLTSEMKVADPDEQRLLKVAEGRVADGYEVIAAGDRERGQKLVSDAYAIIQGIIGKDLDFRKSEEKSNNDFQRELISTAAKGYRQEYQNTYDAANGVNISSQKILALTAQEDFDPNKPLNKAHLAELLSMGGLMFKDTPDMMDGLTQGVSAINGMAGGIVGGIATAMKSSEFKVSKEDYIRLALNAQKYANIFAEQNFTRLGEQGSKLDAWGKKLGALPIDSSLGDYISGGEKELRMTPNPVQSTPTNLKRPPTATSSLVAPTRGIGRGELGSSRPTN